MKVEGDLQGGSLISPEGVVRALEERRVKRERAVRAHGRLIAAWRRNIAFDAKQSGL